MPAMARQWTSRNGGFSAEAELLDVKDGKVILKKTDGSTLTVPLNKLSLGDVRYVNEVLKSAEEGITGGKAESPTTEKPQNEPVPAAAATVDLQKLRYQWKKGQTYAYRVTIKGDRGYYANYYAGDVTYKVKSADENDILLSMSAKMTRGERLEPIDVFAIAGPGFGPGFGPWMMPGPPVMVRSNSQKEVVVTVDPQGRVDHIEGDAQLPFLLGDLSQLMIEQLPDTKKTAWTIANDTGVSVIGAFYPFYRFWGVRYREGVPATEKTVYTILGQTDKQITIAKHYELTTGSGLVNGKPRFEANGDGKLIFNTERGLPGSMDFRMLVTVREANKTEESPVRITYRLLSEEEIAAAQKEADEAKKKEELAKKEKLRPLTNQEIETALVDLASGDIERITATVKLLSEKKPREPSPKIAKALESVMLSSDQVGTRGEAAGAMKNWATPENVPALIKALKDEWPPVRTGAVEALCKFKPKEAIKPISQLMSDGHVRRTATKFLTSMGPDAEDAVLAHFAASSDAWAKADMCLILKEIGTKKSIAPLEKAVMDENWMINGNARKALTAVKARE